AEADMMYYPVAQTLFALLEVSPGDVQGPGSRTVERNFDRLGRLICRLAPIARKFSSEVGPLRLVSHAPPHLVTGRDKWISDNPEPPFVEIRCRSICRCTLVAAGAVIDGEHASL